MFLTCPRIMRIRISLERASTHLSSTQTFSTSSSTMAARSQSVGTETLAEEPPMRTSLVCPAACWKGLASHFLRATIMGNLRAMAPRRRRSLLHPCHCRPTAGPFLPSGREKPVAELYPIRYSTLASGSRKMKGTGGLHRGRGLTAHRPSFCTVRANPTQGNGPRSPPRKRQDLGRLVATPAPGLLPPGECGGCPADLRPPHRPPDARSVYPGTAGAAIGSFIRQAQERSKAGGRLFMDRNSAEDAGQGGHDREGDAVQVPSHAERLPSDGRLHPQRGSPSRHPS